MLTQPMNSPSPASPTSTHRPSKAYLWAVGGDAETLSVGKCMGDRYEVIAPRIWLNTQPEKPPAVSSDIPPSALPYLKAFRHRLHLPGLYTVLNANTNHPVLLLDNVPINRVGEVLPDWADAWEQALPVRQVHWLWQIATLWQPLHELGVASSLLVEGNIRVEGWRIRLRQLYPDTLPPTLADLGDRWQALVPQAHPHLAAALTEVCTLLRSDAPSQSAVLAKMLPQLNHLLLTQLSDTAIRIRIAGGTTPGPSRSQNEDACYPDTLNPAIAAVDPLLSTRMAIVCDGVGGHEGGEVASQLVLRSLQLQLRGLLIEAQEQEDIIPPELVAEQIETAIRVANNLIASQNDSQGRADRQRMGTTLVLALLIPQRVRTPMGSQPLNELYIAHVGDSRAYWITPHYCHQLTVDDDISTREVITGRSLHALASRRPDAGALTQAIGTREAAFLKPHIQRFVLDEDGVLLLCSDGLSDHHRVEEAWANYIGLIVKDIVTLNAATSSWLELANQKNGHDNTSVVLMHCKVTPAPARVQGTLATQQDTLKAEWTEASKALLYGEAEADEVTVEEAKTAQKLSSRWTKITMAATGVILLATLVLAGWILSRFGAQEPTPSQPPTEQSSP